MHLAHLVPALATIWISSLAVCAADRVAEGGACSQSNNKLIAGTGNFVSDCDARTFCNDQGVCQAKGCRKDYVSFVKPGFRFSVVT
jgi:hypothetical protein